jgi:hypothetical protein
MYLSPDHESVGHQVQEPPLLSGTDGKHHDPAHRNGQDRAHSLDVPEGTRVGLIDRIVLRRKHKTTPQQAVGETPLPKRDPGGYFGGIGGCGGADPGLSRGLPRGPFAEKHYRIGRSRALELRQHRPRLSGRLKRASPGLMQGRMCTQQCHDPRAVPRIIRGEDLVTPPATGGTTNRERFGCSATNRRTTTNSCLVGKILNRALYKMHT